MGVEPLILGSYVKLEVGAKYHGPIHITKGEYHKVPYVVLREATRDEWLANLEADGITPSQRSLEISKTGFFYEVSVD